MFYDAATWKGSERVNGKCSGVLEGGSGEGVWCGGGVGGGLWAGTGDAGRGTGV